MSAAIQELTRILHSLSTGDPSARIRLLACIYDELHQLAGRLMRGERADHTLQTTALVHEAYLRLFGSHAPAWENRGQLFGAAAEVMRRVLIDHARERGAVKRGGKRARAPLDSGMVGVVDHTADVLSVDEAVTALETQDPRKAAIVKLRFFAGLTVEEIAAVLEIAPITVKRDWRFAKAWLMRRMDPDAEPNE